MQNAAAKFNEATMNLTPAVQKILSYYESDNAKTKENLDEEPT